MASVAAAAEKPHAVCIPFPAQGHVNPMMKLAKELHSRGFHITFVSTDYNHQRLLKSRGPSSLKGLHDFRFRSIPDGLPPSDLDGTQDILALCESTMNTCLDPFRELLVDLNASNDAPLVSCVVSDSSMTFTLDAAQEIGVPGVLLDTLSACATMGYMQYGELIRRGVLERSLDGNSLSLSSLNVNFC